jgi:hypothetical protein
MARCSAGMEQARVSEPDETTVYRTLGWVDSDALDAAVGAWLADRTFHPLAWQRQASGHTIAAYRDAFKLLLTFVGSTPARRPRTWRSPIWTLR